jgi:tetratricopeptide (TPR) repeat protein
MLSECPDPETLVLLGTPALGDATCERYVLHIDGCPNCQAVLQRYIDEGLIDSGADPSTMLDGPEELPRVPGFVIERKLGSGATGVVYLARQNESERVVALKLIPGGHTAGARERRVWLREVRAASKVRHPHVVTLYDFGESGPWFFLVLEFIPGGSLRDRLKGRLTARSASRLVEMMALAVHQIHLDGLFHLDLKPSNILLEGDAETPWEQVVPKVTDFSVARIASDVRATLSAGMPFGTPAYMAPEQTGSSPAKIGAASDVYGLGAVLYELLTGRPPIPRGSVVEMLEAINNDDPILPRRLNPAIPCDVETICLKCLEKQPEKRYQSAEALGDDLRRWLDNRPIKARPVSSFEKTWRACARRPIIASLAALLLLTLFGGFGGMFVLWRRAEAERARAEADFEVATAALGEFTEFRIVWPSNGIPGTQFNFVLQLQRIRELCLKLSKSRPDHRMIRRRLAFTDHYLSTGLYQFHRTDEARALMVEAIALWEELAVDYPRDADILSRQADTLVHFAEIVSQEGRIEESARVLSRVVDQLESVLHLRPDNWVVSMLSRQRLALAELRQRLGRYDQARLLFAANTRMMTESPSDLLDQDFIAEQMVRQTELYCSCPESEPELARANVNTSDSLSVAPLDVASRTAAEAWAERLMHELAAVAGNRPDPSTEEVDAGYAAASVLFGRASQQRRSGQIANARQTTDRLNALARLLVTRYPEKATSHLAMSQTFSQAVKDAYAFPKPDFTVIRQNLKLAVDETRHASRLAPNDKRIRDQLETLEQRLEDLPAPKLYIDGK